MEKQYPKEKKLFFLILLVIIQYSCNDNKNEIHSYYGNDRIVIKAVFNDRDTGRFIVDTGGGLISLDSSFYADVIKPKTVIGKPNFSAGPGSKKIKKVVYDSLSFRYKSKNYENLMFSVFNFDNFLSDYYDGIIGDEFLKDKILLLDFENEDFDFIQRATIKEYAELDSIPITFSKGKPCIEASVTLINSSIITGNFILDTGFQGFVMLWQHVAEAHIGENAYLKKLTVEVKNANISGDMKMHAFVADSFKNKLFEVKKPIIAYEEYENPVAVKNPDTYQLGVIGNDLLSNYLIILDYPMRKMYFRPYKDIEQEEFYRAGFEPGGNKNMGLIVQALIYNSPADSAGIQIDDILLEANGVKATEANRPKIIKLLRTPGTVNLKLKRNDSIFEKQVPVKKLL
jgi:predicted aspartyl protease